MAVACISCAAARSATFTSVAAVMAVGWLAAVAWFFTVDDDRLTWGYAVIAFAQAYAFWRLSRTRLFPSLLFAIHMMSVAVYLFSTITHLEPWWVGFWTNRLFELALAYIIGGAIYRIRVRSRKRRLRGAHSGVSLRVAF